MLCSRKGLDVSSWMNIFKQSREHKIEWQCSMSMTKYAKYEEDELWSIKWMRCTMADKINEMDYGRWHELGGLWLVNT